MPLKLFNTRFRFRKGVSELKWLAGKWLKTLADRFISENLILDFFIRLKKVLKQWLKQQRITFASAASARRRSIRNAPIA